MRNGSISILENANRPFLDSVLRHRFAPFVHRSFQTVVPGQDYLPNWHVLAISHVLELCARGEIRRLIITMPPRSLKSICASVAFPAWLLGLDPRLRIVCVSYSQELAAKHARDFRAVLESEWYQRLFPGTQINPRKNTESEIETTALGNRYATSMLGTLTGRGGNFIIIDDSMKPTDASSEVKRGAVNEWFDGTLASRLDRKTQDVIIIVQQRLHVDDLVGHVLEKSGGWVHLNLPAIARNDEVIPLGGGRTYYRAAGELLHPEREPLSVLEQLKIDMGSRGFSAQYQQAPLPPEGDIIKSAWFQYYDDLPEPIPHERIVQSWDTASRLGMTNDYSVCTTWLMQGENYYLLDVYRERLEFPALVRKVRFLATEHDATAVLIEDAGIGMSLIQTLREQGFRAIPIRPEADKETRMEGQSAVIEAGRVWLPSEAPWLAEFLHEVVSFPGERHDDQVDSLSQFLIWATPRSKPRRSPRAYFFTPGSGRGVYVAGGDRD